MELKKIMKMGSFSSKIGKSGPAPAITDHGVLMLLTSHWRPEQRASFVIPHVCDPNDIQGTFDTYHHAHYIREWRSCHHICVREAVHRERHEEGADRQHG